MKIVIDIPEKEFGVDIDGKFQDFFNRLKSEINIHLITGTSLVCGTYELETIDMFLKAFNDSASLPKGHGRLIDADAFIAKLEDASKRQQYKKLLIDDCLTVDDVFKAIIESLQNKGLAKGDAPTIIESDKEAIKSALKYLVHKQREQGSWGYADNDNTNEVSWDEVLEWIDQRPCEDCISRQAVNKLIDELARAISDEKCHIQRGRNYGRIMHDILELPSVEPERKTGKWIKVVNPDTNEWVGGFKCSECDRCCAQMSMNYCANCGASMEVEE